MIPPAAFADACQERGLEFFTGVPDSTYKAWMNYLYHGQDDLTNVVTVNECEATAVAAGYHLATDHYGVVYMQSDGLGKAVNPLTSLTNEEVYNIPMVLLIGWRSEPGTEDAVQHDKMGEILLNLLDLLDVPYQVVPRDTEGAAAVLDDAIRHLENDGTPYAMIVRQETFDATEDYPAPSGPGSLTREEAVQTAVDQLEGEELVLGTTGKLSRELYEYRKARGDDLGHDFYNVGAMGCVQSIAFGMTFEEPDRPIVVFDGDGSVLMQLGALSTTGNWQPPNYHHFIFDNAAHDSTGGQDTVSPSVDFAAIAESCGYRTSTVATEESEIADTVTTDLQQEGPTMTVIEIDRGARPDLGRPTESLGELKQYFMRHAGAG